MISNLVNATERRVAERIKSGKARYNQLLAYARSPAEFDQNELLDQLIGAIVEVERLESINLDHLRTDVGSVPAKPSPVHAVIVWDNREEIETNLRRISIDAVTALPRANFEFDLNIFERAKGQSKAGFELRQNCLLAFAGKIPDTADARLAALADLGIKGGFLNALSEAKSIAKRLPLWRILAAGIRAEVIGARLEAAGTRFNQRDLLQKFLGNDVSNDGQPSQLAIREALGSATGGPI